jgi:hypothetical protein
MRARDAENIIAEALTKGINEIDAEHKISESVLLGLRRSSPIYAQKIKKQENATQRQRFYFYRRILLRITYPVRALVRILCS